jgi:hypothetical protein
MLSSRSRLPRPRKRPLPIGGSERLRLEEPWSSGVSNGVAGRGLVRPVMGGRRAGGLIIPEPSAGAAVTTVWSLKGTAVGDTEGPTGGETSSIHPTSDPMGTGSSEGVAVTGVGHGVADGTGPGSPRTCADVLAAVAVRATLPVALGLWAAWLTAVAGPVDPLAGAPRGIGTPGPTSSPGRERLLSEEPGAAVASLVVVGRLPPRPIMGGRRTVGPVTPEANANPAVASSRTLEADLRLVRYRGAHWPRVVEHLSVLGPSGHWGERGGGSVHRGGRRRDQAGLLLDLRGHLGRGSGGTYGALRRGRRVAWCVMAYRSQFVPAETAVVGGGASEGARLTGLVCRARAQAPEGRLAGSCVAVVRELGVSVRLFPFEFLSTTGLCSGPRRSALSSQRRRRHSGRV